MFEFICSGELTPEEKVYCLKSVEREAGTLKYISTIRVRPTAKTFEVDYTVKEPPFERIRRITGYLGGNVARWNDAKRAELRDRVPHALSR